MGATEILAVATSFSLLSGWRLYATVMAVGIAMATGWLHMPTHLAALDVLANPWVIGAAGVGFVAEFFADKIAWLDSAWDSIHTFIRPLGGALLTLAIVDPADSTWQVIAFLLGGGGALLSHGVKAGTRAVVNASPEPFSNAIVSTSEDIATGGLIALTLAQPQIAAILALCLLVASIIAFFALRRLLRRLGASLRQTFSPDTALAPELADAKPDLLTR